MNTTATGIHTMEVFGNLDQGIGHIMHGEFSTVTPTPIVLPDGREAFVAAKVFDIPETDEPHLVAVGLARYIDGTIIGERHKHLYDDRARFHPHLTSRCQVSLIGVDTSIGLPETDPIDMPRRLTGNVATNAGMVLIRDLVHSDGSNDLFGARSIAMRRLVRKVDFRESSIFTDSALRWALVHRLAR